MVRVERATRAHANLFPSPARCSPPSGEVGSPHHRMDAETPATAPHPTRQRRVRGWSPALAALVLVAATPALPADSMIHELRVGVLNHDTDGLWSGSRRENGPDLNVEVSLAASREVFRGDLRPALGATVNTRGDTSKVYAYARWEHELRGGFWWALGFGAAVHDGATGTPAPDEKALGSRVLFHTAIEAGYHLDRRWSVSLYFDHMSNAGLADENEGMDTLGIRLGRRW